MKENILNERIKRLTASEKIEIIEIMTGIRLLAKTSPELANLAVNALLFKFKTGHIPLELNPDTWNFKEKRMS